MPLSDAETLAMIEEIVGRASLAVINTLNAAAGKIFERSQIEVPKSEDHQLRPNHPSYPAKPLQESGRVDPATPESHVAQVVYDSPYAAAQEVGTMTYESKHGKPVTWEARDYTTPGTKSRYLEDPTKSALGLIPEELAIQGRIAFGELSGLQLSSSELRAIGQQFRK